MTAPQFVPNLTWAESSPVQSRSAPLSVALQSWVSPSAATLDNPYHALSRPKGQGQGCSILCRASLVWLRSGALSGIVTAAEYSTVLCSRIRAARLTFATASQKVTCQTSLLH